MTTVGVKGLSVHLSVYLSVTSCEPVHAWPYTAAYRWRPTWVDCGLSIRGRWSAGVVLIRDRFACTESLWTQTQQTAAARAAYRLYQSGRYICLLWAMDV